MVPCVHCAALRRAAIQSSPMPGPTSIASGAAIGSRPSHAAPPLAGIAAGAPAVAADDADGAGAPGVTADGAIGARPAAGSGAGATAGAGAGASGSGSMVASGTGVSAGCFGSLGSRARFSRAFSMRPGRICGRSICRPRTGFCGTGGAFDGVCSRRRAKAAMITMGAPYHRAARIGSGACPPGGLQRTGACVAPQKHDAGRMCVPRREVQGVRPAGGRRRFR